MQMVFQIGTLQDNPRKVLLFAEFVHLVTHNNTDCDDPQGLHACTYAHWMPQVMTCGLDNLLPHFDFIGSFDHMPENTKMLLEKVGLWDKYGKVYDDGSNAKERVNICAGTAPVHDCNYTTWGFNQHAPMPNGVVYKHATFSKSKFGKYYTPELLAKVQQAYALDYAIWNDLKER